MAVFIGAEYRLSSGDTPVWAQCLRTTLLARFAERADFIRSHFVKYVVMQVSVQNTAVK